VLRNVLEVNLFIRTTSCDLSPTLVLRPFSTHYWHWSLSDDDLCKSSALPMAKGRPSLWKITSASNVNSDSMSPFLAKTRPSCGFHNVHYSQSKEWLSSRHDPDKRYLPQLPPQIVASAFWSDRKNFCTPQYLAQHMTQPTSIQTHYYFCTFTPPRLM
jgi:hypothetical protein